MTIDETIQFINDPSLQMEGEVWKQHPVYTRYYGSNLGRVKYINRWGNETIKKQALDKRQQRFHMRFDLAGNVTKDYRTARFICECFNGLSDDLEVDHINTVPYDNRIDNLRFCTRSENCNNPLTKPKMGKLGGLRSKIRQFSKDGRCIGVWNGFAEIKDELGFDKRAVYDACRGKSKTAYGFRWEYYNEPDLEGEVWKQHPALNIQVSNKGRVKKFKKNGLSYIPDLKKKHSNGYVVIQVNNKKYQVHRLVAEMFVPNPGGGDCVFHIDGDTANNNSDNLLWCTMSEIMIRKKFL